MFTFSSRIHASIVDGRTDSCAARAARASFVAFSSSSATVRRTSSLWCRCVASRGSANSRVRPSYSRAGNGRIDAIRPIAHHSTAAAACSRTASVPVVAGDRGPVSFTSARVADGVVPHARITAIASSSRPRSSTGTRRAVQSSAQCAGAQPSSAPHSTQRMSNAATDARCSYA